MKLTMNLHPTSVVTSTRGSLDSNRIDRARVFGELQGGAFERVAPGYFPAGVVREHEARYRWAARYVAGKTVLDVGCGTAYGCSLLTRSGARHVTGVDIALPALQHGKQSGITGLVCANMLQLPFGPLTFEVVTCFEVIEHIVEQPALLQEMTRLLARGGIMVLSTPNRNRTSGNNPYHLRELSSSELTSLVARSGLTCIERSGQHWGLRPAVLRRIYGIRRAVYGIENTASVFRVPEIIAEPSVYLLAARKEH
jgi:2-polyprenyl-3-methyl-5-hydroxy-6-metoxy-1,4-benzoquinol methylase